MFDPVVNLALDQAVDGPLVSEVWQMLNWCEATLGPRYDPVEHPHALWALTSDARLRLVRKQDYAMLLVYLGEKAVAGASDESEDDGVLPGTGWSHG